MKWLNWKRMHGKKLSNYKSNKINYGRARKNFAIKKGCRRFLYYKAIPTITE